MISETASRYTLPTTVCLSAPRLPRSIYLTHAVSLGSLSYPVLFHTNFQIDRSLCLPESIHHVWCVQEHGFNPEELETGEWARFLKFSGHSKNVGAMLNQKYINFIGGSVS